MGAAGTYRWRGTVRIACSTPGRRAQPAAWTRSTMRSRSDSGVRVAVLVSFMPSLPSEVKCAGPWVLGGRAGSAASAGEQEAGVPARGDWSASVGRVSDELYAGGAFQECVVLRRSVALQVL